MVPVTGIAPLPVNAADKLPQRYHGNIDAVITSSTNVRCQASLNRACYRHRHGTPNCHSVITSASVTLGNKRSKKLSHFRAVGLLPTPATDNGNILGIFLYF